MQKIVFFLLFVLISFFSFSQNEKPKPIDSDKELVVNNKLQGYNNFTINPLAPAKAAFYSAILPGLGQAYNKRYWLIPVIYGGIGGSMYVYNTNNTKYNDFLTAYKLELAGKSHEFANLDITALERGINGYKKQRDLWLFISIGIYILNIVEANVDAHLPNKGLDTDLSYKPSFIINPVTHKMNYGLTISFDIL